MELIQNRLALGTAQFGLKYGVANRNGQIHMQEVAAILRRASRAGLNTLDTAIAYGDSEERLGQIGVSGWNVITKIQTDLHDRIEISGKIRSAFTSSLDRLQIPRLYGLLHHRPSDFLGSQGTLLYAAMEDLKQRGLVKKIGISIYAPEELEHITDRFSFDIVQAPFNIVDRRLVQTGWLEKLKEKSIEVHVRSIFLQGLLLMGELDRPAKFQSWKNLWKIWHDWLSQLQVSPQHAALGFVLAQPQIDRVIIGVDSLAQLEELLGLAENPVPKPPQELSVEDQDLVDPSRWCLL